MLATTGAVPSDCTLLLAANPRTTFLPAESAALRSYLAGGGSALLLFDLGFVPEPGLSRLLSDLGVRLEQQVVVDPLSHYQSDPEMVAVTGYDPHPITRTLSLTFFPGIRPLTLTEPASGVVVTPILQSSRDSYARPVPPADARTIESLSAAAGESGEPVSPAAPVAEVRPRVLGIAAEGALASGAPPLRAVVIGDGDFASNSFLPYMANSDLLLAAVRWLAREERGTAVRTRIPVPPMILLTAAQSRCLFALIVILLPLTVIGIGGLVWWLQAMSALSLSRLVMPLLAMLALAYLVAMVVTGAQPVQRQLVKFEAKGVLQIEPQAVQRITLGRGGRQVVLVRNGEGRLGAGARRRGRACCGDASRYRG